MQGTLGYTAAAVGLALISGPLFLVFLSTRFGALASRYGPRIFMTVGPALMAVGMPGWRVSVRQRALAVEHRRSSDLPAADRLPGRHPARPDLLRPRPVDPGRATHDRADALVPGRQAGLASAINNAISRVGPQLAGAVIFVIVTAASTPASPIACPAWTSTRRRSRAAPAAQRAGSGGAAGRPTARAKHRPRHSTWPC